MNIFVFVAVWGSPIQERNICKMFPGMITRFKQYLILLSCDWLQDVRLVACLILVFYAEKFTEIPTNFLK